MMKRVKSLGLSLLVFGGIMGLMYIIPINIEQKNKVEIPKISEEEQLLGTEEDTAMVDRVEVPEIMPIAPVVEAPKPIEKEEPKLEPIVEVQKAEKVEKKKEEPKKEEIQKNAKKEEEKKMPQKESKIGVDRKLISGIPGTMKYKGAFPKHNVTQKGSITISYVVSPEGNVVSAYRIDGLRDKNTINNAISMLKKYVKAEKSKQESMGTYTIEFK